jgi:predicted permease
VLAEKLWRGRFGGDPSLVGRTIRVNDRPFTIGGIVPASFVGLDDHGVAWIPVTKHPVAFKGSTMLRDARAGSVRFYGRLGHGTTREAAQDELKALVGGLRHQDASNVWEGEWLDLRPAGRFVSLEQMNGAGVALIATLIGLVLVTACMNLGLLLLARSIGREREFAIRLSVGATRARIVRQLVTEHLLIALLGAAAGCVVSAVATRVMLLITAVPEGITTHFTIRVALVAAVLAVLSSLLFGFTPAVQALKPAPSRLRFRNTLLALQVGAACVLLIVSALLVRGVLRVTRVPLGFEYQKTLMVDPRLSSYGIRGEAAQAYWRELDRRARAVGGVADTAISTLPPFGRRISINRTGTIFFHVTPSYFETMQIRVARGRAFSTGEQGVAVVSETLAKWLWPGEDPLGKVHEGATVIGVAGDARTVRVGDASATECYLPIETQHLADAIMVVRVTEGPAQAAREVRNAAATVDARIAPAVELLRDKLEAKLESPRQMALVTSALGLCALLLAVTGLAGLVSFTVSQRVREIGVRVALGAGRVHILRAMARPFALPTAVGLAGGGVCSVLVATVLSRELFGLSPVDPISYGGAALLFALAGGAATLPSLRRATRVDPMAALRHE